MILMKISEALTENTKFQGTPNNQNNYIHHILGFNPPK